jgi:hypothetical protein
LDTGVRSCQAKRLTKRHGVNPWLYVRHLLAESAARKPNADFSHLLPDAWTQAGAEPLPAPH